MKTKLKDLIPDDKNFNKGTIYGKHLMESSLKQFGAGRSILIDKNNRIIAGNKTVNEASEIGLDNVLIVETTGDQLVAVKRSDIDLSTKRGREMALADNATSKANINWDIEEIEKAQKEFKIDAEQWGIEATKAVESFQDKEDEFEKEIKEITDKNCEMPIVPKFFEEHECFVIVCNNQIDNNFVRDLFDLNKNYKSESGDGKERKTNVISIDKLRSLIK